MSPSRSLSRSWSLHDQRWRNPLQIVSQWQNASDVRPGLLTYKTTGDWQGLLRRAKITLLVTREYEHLLVALRQGPHAPANSYMALPHPSGIAVDRKRGHVFVASTRNPNQIYELAPVQTLLARKDRQLPKLREKPLVPLRSRFLPGSLYIHDLVLIQGRLYAAAAGCNAIVELPEKGGFRPVWWPRCIDTSKGPWFGQNQIQLNSIAAGPSLATSAFSASSAEISSRRPGDPNYPVDGRGVIFDGRTRQPLAGELTRPHSARRYQGQIWVNNSGYGELGVIRKGSYSRVARLPGWTRGLCFWKHIAFVGTSRVIARFRQYAPGLRESESVCGIHAVDTRSGKILGSLTWPAGNQIFGIDWAPSHLISGFPFHPSPAKSQLPPADLFYAFSPHI